MPRTLDRDRRGSPASSHSSDESNSGQDTDTNVSGGGEHLEESTHSVTDEHGGIMVLIHQVASLLRTFLSLMQLLFLQKVQLILRNL